MRRVCTREALLLLDCKHRSRCPAERVVGSRAEMLKSFVSIAACPMSYSAGSPCYPAECGSILCGQGTILRCSTYRTPTVPGTCGAPAAWIRLHWPTSSVAFDIAIPQLSQSIEEDLASCCDSSHPRTLCQ